jgi:hypothetical protein
LYTCYTRQGGTGTSTRHSDACAMEGGEMLTKVVYTARQSRPENNQRSENWNRASATWQHASHTGTHTYDRQQAKDSQASGVSMTLTPRQLVQATSYGRTGRNRRKSFFPSGVLGARCMFARDTSAALCCHAHATGLHTKASWRLLMGRTIKTPASAQPQTYNKTTGNTHRNVRGTHFPGAIRHSSKATHPGPTHSQATSSLWDLDPQPLVQHCCSQEPMRSFS